MAEVVKTRTIRRKVTYVRRHFQRYDDMWRRIRGKTGRRPLNACYRCDKQFKDGDPIALVMFERGTNEVMCDACAVLMLDEKNPK